MNTWILHKVSRQKYRKYAIRISLIVHVVMFLTIPFIFIQKQIQEIEDEIAVELIPPKWRLIDPPHQAPVTPPPPVPKIEMPEIEIETPQKRVVEKEMSAIQHKQSLEIAKMPVSVAVVDTQHPSSQNIDVDTPILDTPNLSTDARLEPTADAILSPTVSGGAGMDKAGVTKRRGTGVRLRTKGTGDGIGKSISQTGAAEGTSQIGTGKNNGEGTGKSGNGNSAFSNMIGELTDDIIASSGGLPVDVVFVIDASGSMGDNINAVTEHIGQMVDAYKASEIDYQLGLTHFNIVLAPQRINQVMESPQNNIQVFQLTKNVKKYKSTLYEIKTAGDENALDAIEQTIKQMRFRKKTVKHLIVVTDESFTSLQGYSVQNVIERCQRKEILVNVLGNDTSEDHKQLASETGGSWYAIPEDAN